jgi:hypothetical protein
MLILQYAQAMAYTFINARDGGQWVRPIYLSRSLSSDHITCAIEAVNIYNIQTPIDSIIISPIWEPSYIRVSYYSDDSQYRRLTGSTNIAGHLQSDNMWVIDRMNIEISRDIYHHNTCVSIVLHELLHTRGLYHSDIPGSIMNLSIVINRLTDTEYPVLNDDDIEGLSNINNY